MTTTTAQHLQTAAEFHAWAARIMALQGRNEAAAGHNRSADFYGDQASLARLKKGEGI